MMKYKVGGKMLTKNEWLGKVEQALEQLLGGNDNLWQSDDFGKGKGQRIFYKLGVKGEGE